MKKIPNLCKIKKHGRLLYSPNKEEKKLYQKINKEIRRKYNINLIPRNTIIKNIISILTEGDYQDYKTTILDKTILRTDIKNFYESIDKHSLYKNISQSRLLNNETFDILKPLFFSNSVIGVPMGLPFSSSLSEIYLEEFDRDILIVLNPDFYFRYVDDIIIITNNNYKQIGISKNIFKKEIKSKLDIIFSDNLLERNTDKTKITYNSRQDKLDFEYLGYHFKNTNNKLKIDIAKEKADKIVKRIIHYFGVYRNGNKDNFNFWKLYYRLQHTIYGITSPLSNGKNSQFGLAFSYKFINEKHQLCRILNIIKHNIFSCKMSSKKTFTLFSLIKFKDSPLEILNKKYDYRKITSNQFKVINKRLNIDPNNISTEEIFYVVHKNKYT